MKIGIVHQYYTPDISAVSHLAASLAEHRAALGDQVTVVTSRGGYVPEAKVQSRSTLGNPRVHRLWTPRLGKRTHVQRLADYVAFYGLAAGRMAILPRQDLLVLLTTPPFVGWTGVLHRLVHRRTKLLLWNMDCYPEVAVRSGLLRRDSAAERMLKGVNRAFFRQLDQVVCLDQAMVDLLDSEYGLCQQARVTVISNWEPAATAPSAATAAADRRRRKDSKRFVVLYHGNAGFGHEFETVIDAARRMRDDPITFRFVGGGAKWTWLAAQKERFQLDNVQLHGYVPLEETSRVKADSDCALITLRDEMLGVMSPSKLHSSLAAGLPILYVGPQGSNVDEAVVRFQCGASFSHGDVDGIVDFVRCLAREPQMRQGLGERSRLAFDRAYCAEATLGRFDDVISATMSTDQSPQLSATPCRAA